jgi:hypothetical protein
MSSSTTKSKTSKAKVSTAEAFYLVFCALPKKDRFAVAYYILQNDEIRQNFGLPNMPNDITFKAFHEDKTKMPVFQTIEEFREDLYS